ncbi:dihydrolipoyl dehydrogenase [Candidatus Uabimicrobium sp. HlEnr_7]|uniref:dihydrolipoyl dehydrogenase n=1 Tax=Candidatus Uabimicrobium helgolandensis TaxID=3095367 RepID=UPI003557C351
MAKYDYDLLVIGSGPGGYVAGIRASQLGMKVGVIEKDKPGGVCLNIGCIPSKALIHQAHMFSHIKDLEDMGLKVDTSGFDYTKVFEKSRKAATDLSGGITFLLKKNKADYIVGEAKLTGPHQVTVDGNKKITAKNIMIATGSSPRSIPSFPIDEETIVTSNGALMTKKLPKKLLILGSGAIGMEFAYVWSSFGVEVEIVEIVDRVLPIEDDEIGKFIKKTFEKRGVKFHLGTMAKSLEKKDGKVNVTVSQGEQERVIETDMVLVAIGRAPNSQNLGLENLGIKTEKGFIRVGDYYRTNIPNIYAIGDVIHSPLLAHVASKEGEIAVEHMAGHKTDKKMDALLIPSAVYCEPQVASFGYNERTAKEAGIKFEKAVFPYRGAGKSVAIGCPEGMVKVLFDPKHKEILGAHIAGAQATELIHEILLAKKAELLPEDLATMVHAHPTLSEIIMEVMRTVEGWPIHA